MGELWSLRILKQQHVCLVFFVTLNMLSCWSWSISLLALKSNLKIPLLFVFLIKTCWQIHNHFRHSRKLLVTSYLLSWSTCKYKCGERGKRILGIFRPAFNNCSLRKAKHWNCIWKWKTFIVLHRKSTENL